MEPKEQVNDDVYHDFIEMQAEINREIIAQMQERHQQKKTIVEMDVW